MINNINKIVLLFIFLFSINSHGLELPIVAINQIVEHPSLDAVREGVMESLNKNGFKDQENITILYENAQGNITTSMQISQKIVALKPEVIITISTPSSQTTVAAVKDSNTPIVFAAVSDPLYAKLIKDANDKKRNITGATDVQPLDQQLDLIKEIMPNIKRLGVIYNNGEVNSVKIVSDMKINDKDIEIIESIATKSSDVISATTKLIGKVDAIFIPLDNTIVSALSSVLKVTNKALLPVFSSDPDLVKKGILASTGISYRDIGNLAGQMASKILNGESASSIPITSPKNAKTYINLKAATILGINIDNKILNKADFIYHSQN